MLSFLRRRRFALLFTLLLILLVGVAMLWPWKVAIEERLKGALEAQGFKNVQLTLSGLTLKTITLKDISLGTTKPLVLKDLTLNYSLQELLSGHLQEIILSGLTFEAQEESGQWVFSGVEKAPGGASKMLIPISPSQLPALTHAKLQESHFHAATPQWQLDVPLSLEWTQTPAPQMTYAASNLTFKARDLDVTTGDAKADLTLNEQEKTWAGTWEIKNISIKGTAAPLPPLQGSGTLNAGSDNATISGEFISADNATRGAFRYYHSLSAPEKSTLTLVSASLPWNGGKISVQNVMLPLGGKKDVHFAIKVERVSVDELMQLITGKRAKGSGMVSGMLPITLKADGTILVDEGKLQADGPGTIALEPDVIPGDNEQVVPVRDILKDLHYKLLSIGMTSDKDHKLSILMTLEGNNPAVYDGRAVKLNVRLNGDLIKLLNQSVMSILNPTQFLKQNQQQDQHAK
jgi:hypothetical protein